MRDRQILLGGRSIEDCYEFMAVYSMCMIFVFVHNSNKKRKIRYVAKTLQREVTSRFSPGHSIV